MQLTGKTAIVTGAARGIGRAIVEKLASLGAAVVIADILDDDGGTLVETLAAKGQKTAFVHTDVTNAASVKNAVEEAASYFGGLDVVVNNAGISGQKALLEDITEKNWDKVMNVNLKSQYLMCKAALPYLKKVEGCIVNISSGSALTVWPKLSPYVVSKYAVIGLTRSLAFDYAPDKVRVNAICPGSIETPMLQIYANSTPNPKAVMDYYTGLQPLGLGRPDDIANGVAWLASDEARFVTGIALPIDGGGQFNNVSNKM